MYTTEYSEYDHGGSQISSQAHQNTYDYEEQWSDGSVIDYIDKREKRRRDTVERLSRFEYELLIHKDQIYQEKLSQLRRELEEIQNGTHSDFIDAVAELESERDQMMENARMYREYQLSCADKLLKTETRLAEEEYKSEKQGLKMTMLKQLEGRKQKLREDKDNLEIMSADISFDLSSRSHHTRKLRKRGIDVPDNKTTKRRNVSSSVVLNGLKENEIWDDLLIMRMKPTKSKVKGKR